jgi:hypothetical protein
MATRGYMTSHTNVNVVSVADIRLGSWRERDGSTYRAAYLNDCVLTAPEHADWSDADLQAEAIAELRRQGMTVVYDAS